MSLSGHYKCRCSAVCGGQADGQNLVPDDFGWQGHGYERLVDACCCYELSVRASSRPDEAIVGESLLELMKIAHILIVGYMPDRKRGCMAG